MLLLTSCDGDGRSGIPTETPAAASSTTAEPTTTVASTTTSAAPAVPVGEVPGNPAAAAAVRPWADDLVAGDVETLKRKCWTISPLNVESMYADKDAVLAALANPGVDGQFAVIWRSPTTEVSVKRSEIASGYACPRVTPAGATTSLNDADARHTVRRYLSRWIGRPLDADDTEDRYRLVCDNAGTWDPTGSGTPIPAPLANNPGKLTGTTAFDDQEITSQAVRDDYVAVAVPVTDSAGVTQVRTFTLTIGSEGYCIGDIEP